jgi:hypothetical protein
MAKAKLMGEPGKRQVEEASTALKRLFWVEKETMRALAGYLISVSNWSLKKILPLHIWQDALRADQLRTRVLELRYPRRDVDQGHDPRLTAFLANLIRVRNDSELVAGIYLAVKNELIRAYEAYLRDADPLDDAPTVVFMRGYPDQIRKQIEEIKELTGDLPDWGREGVRRWQEETERRLAALGGVLDANGQVPAAPNTGMADFEDRPEYVPPLVPVRDPRFTAASYHMPPRDPEKFIERQVWQGINHVNEIWASEITGLVMWKWNDMPWEFYAECARWCYDESRHCMMGEQRLAAWGFQAGVDYPVYADHYESQSKHGELAVFALLHRFEMNGPGWKSGLKADFEREGDTSSSQDFDYDWADESIHLLYGHKWTLYRLGGDIDKLEKLKVEVNERWFDWIDERRKEWDYEPFLSRLTKKISEIEVGADG